MFSDRVVSQDGNVVAVDFGPQKCIGHLSIDIKTSILFQDDQIVLMRCSFSMDGKPVPKLPPVHCIGNLLTGEVKSL